MKYSIKAMLAALKLIKAAEEMKAAPFFSDDELTALHEMNKLGDALMTNLREMGSIKAFYDQSYGHMATMHVIFVAVNGQDDEFVCPGMGSASTDFMGAGAEEEEETLIRDLAKRSVAPMHIIGQTITDERYHTILGLATLYEGHGDMRRIKQFGVRLSLTKDGGRCVVCDATRPKKVSYETFDPTLLFPHLKALYDEGGDFRAYPADERRKGLEAAVSAATGHYN